MNESKHESISSAQRDVWSWKNELYNEVASMPRQAALQTLLGNSEKSATLAGLSLSDTRSKHLSFVAAENSPSYNAKK